MRGLIFRMVAENPTWGAPRIHGELKMLGFDTSERSVLRWMRQAPRSHEPARRWAAFLNNHRQAIAAMDFFTVPAFTVYDRTHLALAKGTPAGRRAAKNPGVFRRISSMPKLGGLHHRYDLAA